MEWHEVLNKNCEKLGLKVFGHAPLGRLDVYYKHIFLYTVIKLNRNEFKIKDLANMPHRIFYYTLKEVILYIKSHSSKHIADYGLTNNMNNSNSRTDVVVNGNNLSASDLVITDHGIDSMWYTIGNPRITSINGITFPLETLVFGEATEEGSDEDPHGYF